MQKNVKLTIISENENGKVFSISKNASTCGRSSSADICIKDPTVSAFHCEIMLSESGEYIIKDRESINGVTINGEFVTHAYLKHGDIIGLGKTKFKFTSEVDLDKARAEALKKIELPGEGEKILVDEIKNISPIIEFEQKRIIFTKRLQFLLYLLFAITIIALLFWIFQLQN